MGTLQFDQAPCWGSIRRRCQPPPWFQATPYEECPSSWGRAIFADIETQVSPPARFVVQPRPCSPTEILSVHHSGLRHGGANQEKGMDIVALVLFGSIVL